MSKTLDKILNDRGVASVKATSAMTDAGRMQQNKDANHIARARLKDLLFDLLNSCDSFVVANNVIRINYKQLHEKIEQL